MSGEKFYTQLKSFTQFIALRVIANKHGFQDHMLAYRIIDMPILFKEDILIVFSNHQIITKTQVIQSLRWEGIEIQKGELPHSQEDYSTFYELTFKVFSSPNNSCLFIASHLSQDIHSSLRTHLFYDNEDFRVQILKRLQSTNRYQSDWFIISCKKKISEKFTPCQGLIKLDKCLTINIRQFINIFTLDKKQDKLQKPSSKIIDLLDIQGKIQQKKHRFELWIEFSFQMTLYYKIQFENHQDLLNILQVLYKSNYQNCIEWEFKIKNTKYQKLDSTIFLDNSDFQKYMIKRATIQMNIHNVVKWNGIRIGQDPFQTRQYEDQVVSPLRPTICPESKPNFTTDFLNKLNEKIKESKQDIMSFRDSYWSGEAAFLQLIIKNWEIQKFLLPKQDLKTIIKDLDYRLNKFCLIYQHLQFKNQDKLESWAQIYHKEYFFLSEYLYKRIEVYINFISKQLKMDTIREKTKKKYIQYVKKTNTQTNRHKNTQSKGKPDLFKQLRQKYRQISKQQCNKIAQQLLQQKRSRTENILDKLVMDFFEEIESINKGMGQIYVQVKGYQKIELKKFFTSILNFQQKYFQWRDVFNLVTLNATKLIKQDEKNKLNFDSALYSDSSCIGCTTFFIHNKDINTNKTIPLRVSQEHPRSIQKDEFREEVCYMLNNCGGVILFNCEKNYGSILPRGAFYDKAQIQQLQKCIRQIIEPFYPNVKLGTDIFLSLVPIVLEKEEPFQQLKATKYEQNEKQCQFFEAGTIVKGFYVARIKVISNPTKVYFWESVKCNQKQYFTKASKIPKKQKTESNPIKRIHKQIKKKFRKYLKATKQHYRPPEFGNPLNHQCKTPLDVSSINTQQSKYHYELMYKFMSMIVVRSSHIPTIRNFLRKENINGHIDTVFDKFDFDIQKFTAVLFHNDEFSKVIALFSSRQELKFDKRQGLSIFVTDYLKIDSQQGLKREDIKTVKRRLSSQFPHEELIYFKAVNSLTNSISYYVKVGRKIATLFVYYVFNQIKVKTIFKNPSESQQRLLQKIPC